MGLLGSLDPRLQTRVNGEVQRFGKRSPRLETEDGPYVFAGESTLAAYRAHPGRYAIHRP